MTNSKLLRCRRLIVKFAVVTLALDGGVDSPVRRVESRQSHDIPHLLQRHRTLPFALQALRGGGPFKNIKKGHEILQSGHSYPPAEVEEDVVVLSIRAGGSEVEISPEEDLTDNQFNEEKVGGYDTSVPLETNVDLEASQPVSSSTKTSGSVFASPKWQNFQQRTIPAVLMLGSVGAWSYYLKEDGMIFLVLLAQVGMYSEATSVMSGAITASNVWNKWWWFVTFSIAVNGPRVFSWSTTTISSVASAMAVAGVVGNILMFNSAKKKNAGDTTSAADDFQKYVQEAAISHLSLLLVVAPSSFWIAILEDYGMRWVIYAAALVMINDTMAYVFGMTLGKHALLPQISPKKTWEGFLGATASTVLASLYLIPSQVGATGIAKWQDALLLSMYASLIGPFGGFLASVIKRAYGKKDFGALIPGHGGLVDRFDCQLIMAPFVYLYLQYTRQQTHT